MTELLELQDIPIEKKIFCNRTLNLNAIKAIGYDMDYTLVHYHVQEWEQCAYKHGKSILMDLGMPIEQLSFDPELVIRGLIIDTELGNLLKVNRFGYVKKSRHGTQTIEFQEQRKLYGQNVIPLTNKRFRSLTTLFALSDGCLYSQLVDLKDEGQLPDQFSYADLYGLVRQSLNQAHTLGALKQEIMTNPDRFVVKNPDTAAALLEQKKAGKRLMLITNAEWQYVKSIMEYAIQPYLMGISWKELFEFGIVRANKPNFFTAHQPLFEIINDQGHLKPALHGIQKNHFYVGGNAAFVEDYLATSGDSILYVGDHIIDDVESSKSLLRWRTALILKEIEKDLHSQKQCKQEFKAIRSLMEKKEALEFKLYQIRRKLLYQTTPKLEEQKGALKDELIQIDTEISPLAQKISSINNPHWGLLMRTGKDKSLLAGEMEALADIYTSQVSNFLAYSPYAFFQSKYTNLPHD